MSDSKYSRKEGLRCRDWSRRLMSSMLSLRKRILRHRAMNEAFAYAGRKKTISYGATPRDNFFLLFLNTSS